jgi:ribosomal protein L37E
MSTATVLTPVPDLHGTGTHSLDPDRRVPGREDDCAECGRGLAESEEHRCADCLDLASHAWCRDCGSVLSDADLDAGACASCEA